MAKRIRMSHERHENYLVLRYVMPLLFNAFVLTIVGELFYMVGMIPTRATYIAITVLVCSGAFCSNWIYSRQRHLMDVPESYGRHRIWIYALMLPMFPCMIISWRRMQQAKRKNAEQDAELQALITKYCQDLSAAPMERRFPKDANEAIIQCAREQTWQSKLKLSEETIQAMIERIREIPNVVQAMKYKEEAAFMIFAHCYHAGSRYFLGTYSVSIKKPDDVVLSMLYLGARTNEQRRPDAERLDQKLLKKFAEHKIELMRWLYTGHIDELVWQIAGLLNDPRNFTEDELQDMDERYLPEVWTEGAEK